MDLTVSESVLLNVQQSGNMTIQKPFVFQSADMKEFVFQTALTVPSPTTDLSFGLGKIVTGKVLYVESDQPISIKLNSSGVSPVLVSKFILLNTEYTALYISNTSGTTATVKVIALGV